MIRVKGDVYLCLQVQPSRGTNNTKRSATAGTAAPLVISNHPLHLSMNPEGQHNQNPYNLPEDFDLPGGYAMGWIGPDRLPIMIPFFMVPSLEHQLEARRAKQQPAIAKASAAVITFGT